LYRRSIFGGVRCTLRYNKETKKCSLEASSHTEEWLNQQCDCDYNSLKFLNREEVGKEANGQEGVKFKVSNISEYIKSTSLKD